jgi:hypothetical protein
VSKAGTRVGIGTCFRYDGETVEVVEMAATTAGNEVVLKGGQGRLLRLSLKELAFSDRAAISPDGPGPLANDDEEIASVVLGQLNSVARAKILERAEHVREVLTGYRSGTSELARAGGPHPGYCPENPWEALYAAKADELGVSLRTVKQWVADFRRGGEAGLAPNLWPDTILLAEAGENCRSPAHVHSVSARSADSVCGWRRRPGLRTTGRSAPLWDSTNCSDSVVRYRRITDDNRSGSCEASDTRAASSCERVTDSPAAVAARTRTSSRSSTDVGHETSVARRADFQTRSISILPWRQYIIDIWCNP